MQPRIVIADDHPIVAEGVRRVLAELPADIFIALNPEEVRMRVAEGGFDLFVLDLYFRGWSVTGFDLLREIKQRRHSAPPVLMVSMFDDPELQEAAREVGAEGFVSKMTICTCLVEAARDILAGGTSFPKATAGSPHLFSTRQLQVSDELAHGLQEKEIARKLGVSVRMIETHLRKAKQSVKAHSLAELIAIFLKRGYQLLPRSKPRNPTD